MGKKSGEKSHRFDIVTKFDGLLLWARISWNHVGHLIWRGWQAVWEHTLQWGMSSTPWAQQPAEFAPKTYYGKVCNSYWPAAFEVSPLAAEKPLPNNQTEHISNHLARPIPLYQNIV